MFYSCRCVFCRTVGLPSFNALQCKLAKIALFVYLMLYWVEGMMSSVISFAYFTHFSNFNPLTPGNLQKVRFLDILVIFSLDLSQITFDPVENAFATQQLAFLATSIVFQCIMTWACAEIKILRQFLGEKVTYIFRLLDFWIFFSPFLFCLFSCFCCSD